MSEKLPSKLPESIAAFLEGRSVRSFEDVIDYASVCARAVADKGLTGGMSKELRLWGELMYTCIHSQNAGDSSVSVIGQLIQIANVENTDLLPTLSSTGEGAESLSAAKELTVNPDSPDSFGGFVDILDETKVCVG